MSILIQVGVDDWWLVWFCLRREREPMSESRRTRRGTGGGNKALPSPSCCCEANRELPHPLLSSFAPSIPPLAVLLFASLLISEMTMQRLLPTHQDKVVAQALVLCEFDLFGHVRRRSCGRGGSQGDATVSSSIGRKGCCSWCDQLLAACSLRKAAARAHHARSGERRRERQKSRRWLEKRAIVSECREEREKKTPRPRPLLSLFPVRSFFLLFTGFSRSSPSLWQARGGRERTRRKK